MTKGRLVSPLLYKYTALATCAVHVYTVQATEKVCLLLESRPQPNAVATYPASRVMAMQSIDV